jgi:hypothetical protein
MLSRVCVRGRVVSHAQLQAADDTAGSNCRGGCVRGEDEITLGTASVIASSRCRRLWISVLHLALHDAAHGDARARAWLQTEACRWICSAAGVEVGRVRRFDLSMLAARRRRV